MSDSGIRRLARGAHRARLADQWTELLTEIRGIDGFQGFLNPGRAEDAYSAAEGGPVIVINVHSTRCDAIVVQPEGAYVIPLQRLTLDDVIKRSATYITALDNYEEAVNAHSSAAVLGWGQGSLLDNQRSFDAFTAANTAIRATLEWLWDSISAPVLTELNIHPHGDSDQVWPRIWWCGTGTLNILPLHAAGYHMSKEDNVLDRVASSFTPSLDALNRARGRAYRTSAIKRLLIIDAGNVPGYSKLQAGEEIQCLQQILPESCDVLSGNDSNKEAIIHHLSSYGYVHLIAHLNYEWWDALNAQIILDDDAISVFDLASSDVDGEFIWLAGCKTALAGLDYSGEALSFASVAFHVGFRNVIASLWNVEDSLSVLVARMVYSDLAKEGVIESDRSALALHSAIRALRDTYRNSPVSWTPFIHFGPS